MSQSGYYEKKHVHIRNVCLVHTYIHTHIKGVLITYHNHISQEICTCILLPFITFMTRTYTYNYEDNDNLLSYYSITLTR